jgi:hypothetical protein
LTLAGCIAQPDGALPVEERLRAPLVATRPSRTQLPFVLVAARPIITQGEDAIDTLRLSLWR